MKRSDGNDGPDAELELSEVGLLNGREDGEESHSWYSANGRGFSVNGRQSETRGDISHIGTVLGERFYSRERYSSRDRKPASLLGLRIPSRSYKIFNSKYNIDFAGATSEYGRL